ncbi:hypothetical protein HPHPA16_0818 [Helicobacter pylori Hp A-16]|nr:hypothetical protein HPHPA16_0818 [Helicobacter pylori Hp A-16]
MSGFSARGGVGIQTRLCFLMVVSNMLWWCDKERLYKRRSYAYS